MIAIPITLAFLAIALAAHALANLPAPAAARPISRAPSTNSMSRALGLGIVLGVIFVGLINIPMRLDSRVGSKWGGTPTLGNHLVFWGGSALSAVAAFADGPNATYSPPTLQHACTWDGTRSGTINTTATPTTMPGDSYVLGPDGQPLIATNGRPVVFPAWLVGRYGYGIGRGANGMHTTDYEAALRELYGSAPIVSVMDAYCVQDIALLVAYSASQLGSGTPFNPGWRQGSWTVSQWETNIMSPIPRRAHLSKPEGFALVMEIQRQLDAIRAGEVKGWERDGYGEWRRVRKASKLDYYTPGRLSTASLGTELVWGSAR